MTGESPTQSESVRGRSAGPCRSQTREASPRPNRAATAFTLIEVLLAIAVLSVLVAVLAIASSTGPDSIKFDEGVLRFETMLHVMRAEAANKGRRFRIAFDEDDQSIKIEYEPQPLAQPGQYITWEDTSWTELVPRESLMVDRCVLTGDSAYRTLTFASGDTRDATGAEVETVVFEPDGTSDSARIELLPTDQRDKRRALIELDGRTGLFTTSVMTPSEWDTYEQEQSDLSP